MAPFGCRHGPTLNTAAARNAYVPSDGASWATFGNQQNLVVVYQGDPLLHNQCMGSSWSIPTAIRT